MSLRMNYVAASPAGMKSLGEVYDHVARSGLEAELVELIYLRVSQINGCAYCIDAHTRTLLKSGESSERLALLQVWREAGTLFDAREQAALAWAETVTEVAQTAVPDDAYEAAAAVFEPSELADMTIAIGLMNAYNRLGIAFRATPVSAKRAVARAA